MAKIRNIDWLEIETAVRRLVASWNEPDVVIGISRGGVPIAIALSYAAPNVPVSFVIRVAARGNNDPFYVFGDGLTVRDQRNENEFRIPELPGEPKSILVVDDVATFGGTLEVVTRLLKSKYPDIKISYYCYAVDRTRLREVRPNLEISTVSDIDIDNKDTWLKMPWQISL